MSPERIVVANLAVVALNVAVIAGNVLGAFWLSWPEPVILACWGVLAVATWVVAYRFAPEW